MKKQTITKQLILEATIDFVAAQSLENITTKKIAMNLGISEGSIFNYFPNKKTLLAHCFYYINDKINEVLNSTLFQGDPRSANIKELWLHYFLYLISHGNYTKFYRQFKQSSYYDKSIKEQDDFYSFFIKIIPKKNRLTSFNPIIYWVYFIETTLNFAIRIIDGELPGEPSDINEIYNLMFHGFIGIFKHFDNSIHL